MSDFGLAKQLNHYYTTTNSCCGTQYFMAPEVHDGKTELKSDVWSLAISLIDMAETAHRNVNYSSEKIQKLIRQGQLSSLFPSNCSQEFVDFLSKCLVKDVKERWTVKQLLNVIVCK